MVRSRKRRSSVQDVLVKELVRTVAELRRDNASLRRDVDAYQRGLDVARRSNAGLRGAIRRLQHERDTLKGGM